MQAVPLPLIGITTVFRYSCSVYRGFSAFVNLTYPATPIIILMGDVYHSEMLTLQV